MDRLPRIDELFAFVSSDDTGEGICAKCADGVWFPLVFAHKANLPGVRKIAKEMALVGGERIKLVRFTVREELEVIEP